MIRLYCDGELPDEQVEQIEARLRADEELARGVSFERNLRRQVGAALRTDCPADLAERVRVALDDAADRPDVAGRPERAAWWRSPSRANFFAVAACLALVAGAVLFGIFGPPIDSWPRHAMLDIASEAAAAVAGEHVNSAANMGALAGALKYGTPEYATRELGELLGGPGNVFDLSVLDYEFLGGNRCAVPNCPAGCHLFYRRTHPPLGAVSLHIVPDKGDFPIRGDAFQRRTPLLTDKIPESSGCQKDVVVWKYGSNVYLLVVCLDEDVEPVTRLMQETLVKSRP